MKRLQFLLAASCLLLFAGAAFAQGDRGTITGTVADPAGAVVPGAAVVARAVETGATYQTVTSGTGNYTLPNLPAGVYELNVTSTGFSKFVRQGIRVSVATTARVDVELTVGSTADSVTVTADAALLRTESAEQSHNITGERINNLPINFGVTAGGYMRSPFAFINLMPGANTSGQNSIRINGTTGNIQMRIEGQESSNSNSAARADEQQPSVEAVQEFTLQTSNFSAEYGQVGGGLFNFTAKSGTNQLHGSVYEYFSNEALNAGIPFSDDGNGHLVRPRVRKHDFGFSVGGPVVIPGLYDGRDRTFFFGNIEWYRDKKINSGTFATVPTDALRAGDFSAMLTGKQLTSVATKQPAVDPLGRPIMENMLYDPATTRVVGGLRVRDPFTNNQIPLSSMDPISVKIQAMIPKPTRSGTLNNYEQVYPYDKTQNNPSLKMDHTISDRQKISGYIARFRTLQHVNPDGLPAPLSQLRILDIRTRQLRLNYDYTLAPTALLHIGAGVLAYRNPESGIEEVVNYDSVGQLGLKGAATTPAGFPRFGTISGNVGGMGLPMGPTHANIDGKAYINDKPSANASLTLIRDNHTIKVGADWRIDIWSRLSRQAAMGAYNFSAAQTGLPSIQQEPVSGGSVGYNYASFLMGTTNTASLGAAASATWRKYSWSFFGQDTWKVTRRLTFDYGLRWDLQEPPHEIFDRRAAFSPNVANPSAGGLLGATVYEGEGPGRIGSRYASVYKKAFGPRLGMAYQITPKTVFRAGWGFSYNVTSQFGYMGNTIGMGQNTISWATPSYGDAAVQFKNGLTWSPAELYDASLNPGIRPSPGQTNSPPNLVDHNGGKPGRINQWNISLQREITTNLAVEAAYVASRGAFLQNGSLVSFNDITPERLKSFGLDINSAADRSLLRSRMDSSAVIARGFTVPYATFSTANTLGQSLRPYPQFGNLGITWAPIGNSWYDALQAKVTKRYSHGLDASLAFTWQKEMETGQFRTVNDWFNRPNQKLISGSSIPLILVAAFNYEVPKLGSNNVVRAIVGGWAFGGILRYASGTPILIPNSNNSLSGLLMRNTFMNRVEGQPLFLVDDLNKKDYDPSRTFVLNPKAWSDPPDGQWGTSARYYSDYRNRRAPDEQLTIGRVFRIRESMSFSIRAEFFNVFNRTVFPSISGNNPTATPRRDSLGRTTGGFGYYNTAAAVSSQTGGAIGTSRNGQIVARFQW